MHQRAHYSWGGVRVAVLLLSTVLWAVPAAAQFQTGTISGRVTDSSGSALPGVTVTLSGPGAQQTFVTDSQGSFRFLNLDPGHYQLSAELAGFGKVSRSSVSVNIGRNTEVEISLTPALQESVTITADAPLLDVRRTGTGATVEDAELQAVPSARDPWVVLQQVPGVLVDRINVGGNESGQQSIYVGKGTSMNQNTWNLDGVNVTDTSSYTGYSPGYFDFDSLAEMQVTTGGTDPRVKTAGVNLNLVTKRGTNEFAGSARYLMTDNEWQAAARIPEEARGYLARVNEIDHVEDFGLEVGGPVIRDRLWFWVAYSEQNVENLAAGATQFFQDDTFLANANLKLNAQILPNNSATLVYWESSKEKNGRAAGPTRPPETTWFQGHLDEGPLVGGLPFFKIEDTHIFGQNLYVTGLYAESNHTFYFDPLGGMETDAWRDERRIWHDSFVYYSSERPTTNARADANAFFDTGAVNHELRFGFGYRDAPTNSVSIWPGSGNWGLFFNAAQVRGLAFITRPQFAEFGVESMDLYVGDTMLWGNLTLQAGLRFDMQSGRNFASSVPANRDFPDIMPAVDFPGDERDLEWNSVSPRIGATYALGANKNTLLRASYNRYADQLSGGTIAAQNPFPFVQAIYYYWDDTNGDKKVQRAELGGLYSWYNVDPQNPGAPFSPRRLDYDMDVPATDEFIVGAEQSFGSDFAVGVNYTWRTIDNLLFAMPEKSRGSGEFYTAADWELARNAAGEQLFAAGTLPNGQSYSIPYYRLRAGVPVPRFSVLTNRPGYSREYNGVELFATKRMSRRWMMRGNVSWNQWTQDLENEWAPNGDPTRLRYLDGCSSCDDEIVVEGSGTESGPKEGVFTNARWSYSLTGMVELPGALSFGMSVVGREGYPVPYGHAVFDGRFFKTVLVGGVDDHRLEDLFNVDLRLAREFRFLDRVGLTLAAEAFNVTDERPVVQRQTILYTNRTTRNPAANRILEIQSPRVLRFGARVTF